MINRYFVESIAQLNDTASVELFYLQAKSLVANVSHFFLD